MHPQLVYQKTGEDMQIDILIQDLNLAFEFQGVQHFKDFNIFGDRPDSKERDEEKMQACKNLGIDLIIVPYWWDRKKPSLVQTILQHRPDLSDLLRGSS